MEIRKLSGKERFDAYLIDTYCFHSRKDSFDNEREHIEKATYDYWGAFNDSGTLMAAMVNHQFTFMLDGHPVPGGGIGSVATLPEYRESGAIRKMFRPVLADSFRRGDVISALYPFNHAFYRKFGYDTVVWKNKYEFSPALLKSYRFDGTVTRWNPGDPVTEYLDLHNRFAAQYNLPVVFDEERMEKHMKTDRLWMDRKFSYLFRQNGEAIACLTFTDIFNNPEAILQVDDCAWLNADGFNAILAFLGRFSADYGTVQLGLPYGIDLLRIIRTSDAYDIRRETCQDYMVRPVHVRKLLEIISKPAGCDFTLRVHDGLISENNATLRVTAEKVSDFTGEPDLELSVQTLGQLAVGAISVDEALLKPDVRVSRNHETLRRVFTEKKILINEHF